MKKRLYLKSKKADYFVPHLDSENEKSFFTFIQAKLEQQHFKSFNLSENELLLQSDSSPSSKNQIITSDIFVKILPVSNDALSTIQIEFKSGLPKFTSYFLIIIYCASVVFGMIDYFLHQKIQLILLFIISLPIIIPYILFSQYLQMKRISDETDFQIRSFFPHLSQQQTL